MVDRPTAPASPVATPAPRDTGSTPNNTPVLSPSTRLTWSPPAKPFFELEKPRLGLERRASTGAEQDSIARVRALEFAEAAARRVPTQAEKDEQWKEFGRPGTIPGRTAGEQGMVATRGSGGGISAPFLSAGPSKAQRRQDDSAAAVGRAILARLQERLRRKQDSLRLADSIVRTTRVP